MIRLSYNYNYNKNFNYYIIYICGGSNLNCDAGSQPDYEQIPFSHRKLS